MGVELRKCIVAGTAMMSFLPAVSLFWLGLLISGIPKL